MRILTLFAVCLLFMPGVSAHEYCSKAACEKIKQKIERATSMVPNTAFCRCWSKEVWPKVRSGDGGFCRWKMLRWCDHHEVGYIIGLAKNKRLNRLTASLQDEAAQTGLKRWRQT